jgi:beta-N-acetylhexosaminidase
MFSVDGNSLTASERDVMRQSRLGGVILFDDNYRGRTQLRHLTRQIQRTVRRASGLGIGALISVDQEGGVVKRFEDMPPNYSAPQMGEMNRKVLVFNQGAATGRALRSAGVNVDFAPVADLDLPPAHVMRSRSFGSSKYRVARLVQAFARGLQSERVAATVKHFPGLGGATRNSDDGRAFVYRTKRQLRTTDAIPFRRAIDRDARMVMLSHAMYPNDGGDRPASVNRYYATRLLRRGFGFTGVSISDALEPLAWRFGGSVPRACVATIRAGVDIALITGNVHTARACANAIRAAVKDGRIPEHRIDSAVERVLVLKSWLRLYDAP